MNKECITNFLTLFLKKRTKKEIKTHFILVCFAKFTLLFSPEKMTKMKKKRVKFRKLEFIFLLFKAFYLKAKEIRKQSVNT